LNENVATSAANRASARTLLAFGAAAGPIYVVVGLAQALTREGFDMRRHALSQLSNGDLGWIQVANFVVGALLVLAGAVGVRRALHPGRAGTWGPILLTGYAVGMLGAAVFTADPGLGFPPGTPMEGTLTTTGILHFVCGAVAFYSLIAACFVFARRFAATRERGWLIFSLFTGVFFFLSFAAVASGNAAPAVMLSLYTAVFLAWAWHSLLSLKLRKEAG
jgi:hypothetical protein